MVKPLEEENFERRNGGGRWTHYHPILAMFIIKNLQS